MPAEKTFCDPQTLQKGMKVISGSFGVNGTGAPVNLAGRGFAVARIDVGMFEITFDRKYYDLICALSKLQLASADDKFAQLGTYVAATKKLRVRVGDASVGMVDEIQHLAFSGVPTSGAWTITFSGSTTGSLAFNANAAAVQAALRLLGGDLAACTVAGDYTSGFDITFAGTAVDEPAVTTTDTLLATATPVDITVTEGTKGVHGVDVSANAANRVHFKCYFTLYHGRP